MLVTTYEESEARRFVKLLLRARAHARPPPGESSRARHLAVLPHLVVVVVVAGGTQLVGGTAIEVVI